MSSDYDSFRFHALRTAEGGLDALVCALPVNVLMFTGYCPVIGTAVCVATSDGRVLLIAPEDEEELARSGHADIVHTFRPATLDRVCSTAQALREPLHRALKVLGLGNARLGYEAGEAWQPAPYAAIHFYQWNLPRLLAEIAPAAELADSDDLLRSLRAVKGPSEIQQIRRACRIAGDAYTAGARLLQPGTAEAEAAASFRTPLFVTAPELLDRGRADGFVYCASGPNSARAAAAYQRSRGRRLASGDLVLIHCNSYVNGWWTDITRTFVLGKPDHRIRRMQDAVFAARDAALDAIHPGVRAAQVDRAARDVLQDRGFGDCFPHGAGHGVGFAAIDHNAIPRLHPASTDILSEGMVFNVEPAVYLKGFGGMRHCDMVAVTGSGAELLTPFLVSPADLEVSRDDLLWKGLCNDEPYRAEGANRTGATGEAEGERSANRRLRPHRR